MELSSNANQIATVNNVYDEVKMRKMYSYLSREKCL